MKYVVIWFDVKGVRLRFFQSFKEAQYFEQSIVTDFACYVCSVDITRCNAVQNAKLWARFGDVEECL